jgi:hypothetical protein
MATIGTNVLIGAFAGDTPETDDNAGIVYLYDVSTDPVTPIRDFQNSLPANNDQFGFAVTAFEDGIHAVISANLDNAGATDAGAVYIYDVAQTSPIETLQNQPPINGDRFGTAIAASGNNLIISAPFNNTGASNAGVVYLFSSNAPPVANAGADQTVECGDLAMLDGSGSSDPDNDPLTYTWKENGEVIPESGNSATPEVTLGFGSHTIELTVDDGKGGSHTDVVVIDVVDTTPPEITLNGANPMTLECHVDSYSELGAEVSDACDQSPSLDSPSGSVNPDVVGSYTITYTATDAHGNEATATRIVNVVDTTPPAITLKSPKKLCDPNHCYVTITLTQCIASVTDACAGSIAINQALITSASSDEPENVSGDQDGYTFDDIVIANDCKSVKVRAERKKFGNGRVYTINLQISDPNGNIATAAFKVLVPRNCCYDNNAVDDGPVYTEFGNCGGAPMTKASNGSEEGEADEMTDVVAPESYALSQNYPNPFNPTTEIRFQLPEAGHVVLKIFNTLGENIVTLVDEDFAVGTHTVRWNAQNARGEKVPSGVYFYQLNTSGFTETKRMILAK